MIKHKHTLLFHMCIDQGVCKNPWKWEPLLKPAQPGNNHGGGGLNVNSSEPPSRQNYRHQNEGITWHDELVCDISESCLMAVFYYFCLIHDCKGWTRLSVSFYPVIASILNNGGKLVCFTNSEVFRNKYTEICALKQAWFGVSDIWQKWELCPQTY
jgi:hypothetical protein